MTGFKTLRSRLTVIAVAISALAVGVLIVGFNILLGSNLDRDADHRLPTPAAAVAATLAVLSAERRKHPQGRGEEGRRVMPAVTLLEGGSWVVPNVGGRPFLRKPPLVQWCIAASLKVFGHNTWAARLPSALSVLALAMVMILAGIAIGTIPDGKTAAVPLRPMPAEAPT